MSKILSDHTKKGKVLTPPLIALGTFRDSDYIENTIPEIIWITLINLKLGLKFGTELGLKFVNTVRTINNSEDIPFYISWYSKLTDKIINAIKLELQRQNLYEIINTSLSPLLNMYPHCPLSKIFDAKELTDSDIQVIKSTLRKLYDKRSIEATFTLGNVFYYLGANGKLHIVKNSGLAELPKLIDYPNTEISKMIASSLRASSNVVISKSFIDIDDKWIMYFWNRGLQIEPCMI
jgi:hypothetical protein